ncbi:hypothetical protein BDY19DRAFT_417466 [Irpex rosettiformis]|uniref:Uncharacterized protein n=1 Tax=Irpex rosettiformis TaxID=378272 RepID=A0ACB8UFZ5_9APHY|nr:hypothetical protein BDY19DRAFT_417466 [Irpex rosettiformis]
MENNRDQKAVKLISVVSSDPFFKTGTVTPVQISDVFNGTFKGIRTGSTTPDTIFRSSDDVYFAVHYTTVADASKNAFGGLLVADVEHVPDRPIRLNLEEPADVLNILFLTMYGIPCDPYDPSLNSLCAALQAMHKYGLTPLSRYLSRGDSPLYATILSQAEHSPLETYALAGEQDIEDLAVDASTKTLDCVLHTISVELAGRMGIMYLMRLYRLMDTREEQMKKLFNIDPKLHEERTDCTVEQQKEIRLDFKYTAGSLCWKYPKVYRNEVETKLNKVRDDVSCEECKAILTAEIDGILQGWMQLPVCAFLTWIRWIGMRIVCLMYYRPPSSLPVPNPQYVVPPTV